MLVTKVKITRFVDDVQPGRVECQLVDAFNVTHRFVDKIPMFTAEYLDKNSSYPVEGELAFEIVESKAGTSVITTEFPWHIESVDGKTEFEIPTNSIFSIPNIPVQIVSIQIGSGMYPVFLKNPIDISIPLNFNGPQPNAYGVDPATSKPCEAGELIGDTRQGGSVNFEQYTLIPHCNGTHTECVGHITNERISVLDCLRDVFIPALLASVSPSSTNFSLSAGEFSTNDLVVTKEALESAIGPTNLSLLDGALILRTLPNDLSKLSRQYGSTNSSLSDIPPYFTTEAMEYIVECGFKHLLVDLPSIDRLYDEGKLTNHRIFWNVEQGRFETNAKTRINSTITEMIYVPSEVEDGEYLLNLQIAPFDSDASPSRPILFKKN